MAKITVISGGAGGLGKAAAKELGKYSTVILADIHHDHLTVAQKELGDLGIESHALEVDIRDQEAVKKLASFSASLGEVVNVIHAAGVSPTDSSAHEILHTNAAGTVNMVNAFYPILAEGGIMINVASIAAHLMTIPDEAVEIYRAYDQPDFTDKMMAAAKGMADGGDDFMLAGIAYCLSKNFVLQFTRMNVLRFASKGCRINSISPGSFLTPMHQSLIDKQPEVAEGQLAMIPCSRWGHPFEFGLLVDCLCRVPYVNGVDILADGGQLSNTMVEQI
jgi:NAD(P)-dependent dehydrogenase (short-subunit alcohol dehydrogenase family)